MCVVSMVGDHFNDRWQPKIPNKIYTTDNLMPFLAPTREEFDVLKKEVENMKKLLERAIKYDKDNNEPACEIEEKVVLLKKVAELVGVSLEDIFPNKTNNK